MQQLFYDKMRQKLCFLFRNATVLLQHVTVIPKSGSCYKMGRLLQNVSVDSHFWISREEKTK